VSLSGVGLAAAVMFDQFDEWQVVLESANSRRLVLRVQCPTCHVSHRFAVNLEFGFQAAVIKEEGITGVLLGKSSAVCFPPFVHEICDLHSKLCSP
jgi:hypothetical protein